MSRPCEKATQLLVELKQNAWIPQYNEEGIRDVLAEMQQQYADIFEVARNPLSDAADPSSAALLLYNHTCFMRNKRCLAAYLHARLHRLRRLRWETAAALPDHIRRSMGPAEAEVLAQYEEMVGGYGLGLGVDLGADLEPPKDVYVEVRVLKDVGEVTTATSVVRLQRNQTFFMRRSDAEALILKGVLQQVL